MAAVQQSGVTTLAFKRQLLTSDRYDVNITSDPLYLLYALAPTDGFGTVYGKHTETGSAWMNFSITNGSALYVSPAASGGGGAANVSAASLGINISAPMFTSPDGVMKVWWSVANGNVTFTMIGNTLGWMSVGIALTPFMPVADDYVVCMQACLGRSFVAWGVFFFFTLTQ